MKSFDSLASHVPAHPHLVSSRVVGNTEQLELQLQSDFFAASRPNVLQSGEILSRGRPLCFPLSCSATLETLGSG